MDGSLYGSLATENVRWPNGLALLPTTNSSNKLGTLYWTDAFYDTLESLNTNGFGRKKLQQFKSRHHPYGVAAVPDTLEADLYVPPESVRIVWAESIDGRLQQIKAPFNEVVTLRTISAPIFDVKFCSVNLQFQIENHPCSTNNGGCSDFCMLTRDQDYVCKCANGRVSTDGGKTCTGKPSKPPCLEESDFQCSDGQCIDAVLVCDGSRDCADGSDEITDRKHPGHSCKKPSCADKGMYECKNGLCIYSQFVCDGEADCEGKEDEENCQQWTCKDDHRQCPSTRQCIPSSWFCDGQRDCAGGEDEDPQHCCPNGRCNTGGCDIGQFMCKKDGQCISYDFRCDNEYDCSDKSDEMNCKTHCDPMSEFKCHSTDQCVPRVYVCDGLPNCHDGSDEKGCKKSAITCRRDEMVCPEGICLKLQFKCDGIKDCLKGEDEKDCPKNTTKSCHWSQFRCDDGMQCIPATWQCDEDFDCRDKSDEKHCAEKCQYPNFACLAHQSMCLPPEKLCNHISDCPDQSDEGRACELDMCLNNNCEKICHISPYGFRCSCPPNQRIRSDNRTCEDIDICETWGTCSQHCSSTADGHRCYCSPGYELRADGYSCKPSDPEPVYLLVANGQDISRFDLKNGNRTRLVEGLQNTVGIDFHFRKNLVFWSDLIDHKIYRGHMSGNVLSSRESVVEFGLAKTEGLAVDWITEHVYWVDSNLDQIEVAKFDGSHRTTLVAGNIASPRALTLDPREGSLFWADWHGVYPRIETCSMAGEDDSRKVVYDIRNHKAGGWPNGLTTDLQEYRLYWIDARSDTIHSITYEGKDHKLIIKDHHTLDHPFSLTVFEHYVYWTDWTNNILARANKFNGSHVEVLHKSNYRLYDLQIFHSKRQPQMKNPCEGHQCSHLCLIGKGLKPVCRCSHRFRLQEDMKTCLEDKSFLLFTKQDEIRGVYLDNANYNVIPSIIVENATSIDYDDLEERLYWTDTLKNVITSAHLNGTGVTTVIDSGLSNPSAFAIDWISRNMYFSSYTDKEASISVAKLDGAYRKEIYNRAKAKPNSIAIHPSLGLMYWSDLDGQQHKIWSAKMDGTNPVIFVQGQMVKEPASLTLDLESNRLYWVNRKDGAVYYCDAVSPCRPQRYSGAPSSESPISMTIYQSSETSKNKVFLFYSNESNIIKYSNGEVMKIRNNTPNVYDLRVYDPHSRKGRTNRCSTNKGGCEQLCLPSGEDAVCACTLGYETKDGHTCKGIDRFLLYAQASMIHGVTLDGKTLALAPISQISHATSIDYHAEHGHIYWIDAGRRKISRIKRDLSDQETVVSQGLSGAESLAVDWIGGNIYWTDQDHNTIEVSKLDGSLRYVVLYKDLWRPSSIVVSPGEGYLYFATGGMTPKIIRARLDGSERVDFVIATKEHHMISPFGLALDGLTGDLYWCDKVLGSIDRVSPKGERFTLLQHGLVDCTGLAVYGENVYWADKSTRDGSIQFMSKTSKDENPQVLMSKISQLKDLTVFDAHYQSGTNLCQFENGGCQELCFFIGEGRVSCACSHGKLMKDGKTCGAHDAFLLYSEVTTLKSLSLYDNKDPNAPRQPIQDPDHMEKVIGLAVDRASERIYFSDIQQGNIQSVGFDGKDFKMVLPNSAHVESLAFDPVHGHLYYTCYSSRNISRVIFTGQSTVTSDPVSEVVVQLGHLDYPRHLVLDPCMRRIFWTNWSDRNPSVQTATYDVAAAAPGTKGQSSSASIKFSMESIITEKIKTPNGLAIDHKTQKLFWSDASLDKIERCDFDGSNRVVILSQLPEHPFGMAVYGNFLYWTDWTHRAVLRINKWDGSGLTSVRKNIARQPMSIVAVAEDADDCTLNPCYNNMFGCAEICLVGKDGQAYCQCGIKKKLLQDGKRCVFSHVQCRNEDFVCEDSRLCIPFNQTCDGVQDCLDSSDESIQYCTNRKCPPGLFQCLHSDGTQACLAESKVCNGQTDCSDGSDEAGCPCADNEFRCSNGKCILNDFRCDYESHCDDHSDEMNCNKTCDDLDFKGLDHKDLIPCNTTSLCIYPSWICDGSNDCLDNNDEVNCENIVDNSTCPSGTFHCDEDKCIRFSWKCDGHNDCEDGTDEISCDEECGEGNFKCNGICLPESWECDGYIDCPDRSDEGEHCGNQNCTEKQFKCPGGRCIPKEWQCDGDSDCDFGEDERADNIAKCTPVACLPEQFSCLNRRCIRADFYCNGDDDCGDESDEPSTCQYRECLSGSEFKCHKGNKCIPQSMVCDGHIDCQDESDETNCLAVHGCHNPTHFQCDNGICLESESLLCNGQDDCGDRSDEPSICGIDECSLPRSVCSQVCVDKKIGYQCECHQGYQMKVVNSSDKEALPKRKCVDVDECTVSLPCSHTCINVIGSFKCSCPEGYRMSGNSRVCEVADDFEPQILVSNRLYLRLIGTRIKDVNVVLKDVGNAVAVDYDWRDQMVYWSEISETQAAIKRMPFNFEENLAYNSPRLSTTTDKNAEPSKPIQTLHANMLGNPDGIAVDWVGRNLYWCDKSKDTIEVSRLNGQYRRVLLKEGLEEPRAIEVFPQKGLLFYTDWGDKSHIGRMGMDGTGLMHIVNENIVWPNALTIDYVTEKLFWGDSHLDYIAMADLNGENVRVIIGDKKETPHVFAITTFEGFLYWTDWERSSVMFSSKFSGTNITKKAGMVHRPMDIHIVHPLRQLPVKDKRGLSPCDHISCSHLCLLRPAKSGQEVEAVCSCPENHYLASDGQTCVSNCTSSQFQCASGSKCIPFWWQCDGNEDCEDGSDETHNCGVYYCPLPGMFQCENANSSYQCFLPSHICDGVRHCMDGSDERNCETYTCMDSFMKCRKDNKCIPYIQKCDGNDDCSDGEDEQCPTKPCDPVREFRCNNSRCISYYWRCDKDDDCHDGSDEPDDCLNTTCRDGHFKCVSTGRCIPNKWKCDGDTDCGKDDNTDEDNEECHSQTCDPNYFRCNNGHCIPDRWRCDHHDDCRDASDERNCSTRQCVEGEFRCTNGKCIPDALVCNSVYDCIDWSDEKQCDPNCNLETQFQCKNIPSCIPKKWRCDSDTDCMDGTDEWECDRECEANEFRCNNSVCQPSQWWCDGQDDCGDNSDEDPATCALFQCPPGKFRCQEHKCIWNSMVCNRVRDCQGGEDEDVQMCGIVNNCHHPNFLCKSRTQCVKPDHVCNGHNECYDGSDEDTNICDKLNTTMDNGCNYFNGGCQHMCDDTKFGPLCSCHKYFVLNADGLTCSLENPCQHYSTCSQDCHFDRKAMKVNCTCGKGYMLATADGGGRISCVPAGAEPVLLMPESNNVISQTQVLHGDVDHYDMFENNPSATGHIVAIDADINTGDMFFINHTGTDYHLIKQSLDKSLLTNSPRIKRAAGTGELKTLHLQDAPLFAMAGLAVDWVGQRVYLSDATSRVIRVYNYQARRGKIVVRNIVGVPQMIAVDPIAGYIFWSSTGPTPRIERSDLDGSNRLVVASTGLSWPTGLAVDMTRGWLYWADTKKHTIEVAKYNGSFHELVYSFAPAGPSPDSPFSLDPPFALDLLGDHLYVLTHNWHRILKLSKLGDDIVVSHTQGQRDASPLFLAFARYARDIVILQQNKQVKVKSNCTLGVCHPTQMCFNKPNTEVGYVCMCPDGARLLDGKCDYVQPPSCEGFCLNGGACNMSRGLPKCSCPANFLGERCEIPTCTSDYCQNNGTCWHPVDQGQYKIACRCQVGYSGPRCETVEPVDSWCPRWCKNHGECVRESSGYITCKCKFGFTGKDCSECLDLKCANDGICMKDSNGQSVCKCPAGMGLDPRTNCRTLLQCKYLCHSGSKSIPDGCDCRCPPSYLESQCTTCAGFCKHGACSMVSGEPVCDCGDFYSGPKCETCKCEPTGMCVKRKTDEVVCSCGQETFGKFCEYSCADTCGQHGHCSRCTLNFTSHAGACVPGYCFLPPWLHILLTYAFYNFHLHQACPAGFSSFFLPSFYNLHQACPHGCTSFLLMPSITFTFTKPALLASHPSSFHPSITFTFTKSALLASYPSYFHPSITFIFTKPAPLAPHPSYFHPSITFTFTKPALLASQPSYFSPSPSLPCWLLIPLTYIFYNLHLHQACPTDFSSFLLTSSTTFTITKPALLASHPSYLHLLQPSPSPSLPCWPYTSYFHPSITFTFTKSALLASYPSYFQPSITFIFTKPAPLASHPSYFHPSITFTFIKPALLASQPSYFCPSITFIFTKPAPLASHPSYFHPSITFTFTNPALLASQPSYFCSL
ncbi:LOW QUALITY PROTEIN: low-density lipoprotein receptor-related protein 1 [Plakobranchus ocellatus]|uniref:Low-density lipoprotein receptor-related protein 1 n=1 Tax=Plakobranchus ocellatus TaxID=259542 RepID=A0AAV4BNV9_9GAST|nr:LOW QUALITY PROTEIN: low-density lipoprotein receptor-related protein 1 [Plakobranchus ocellatus]